MIQPTDSLADLDLLLMSADDADAAAFEARKIELSKSNRQRTQEAADRQWPAKEGDKRYRCQLASHLAAKIKARVEAAGQPYRLPPFGVAPDRGFCTVDVNAADHEEAQRRYMKIMGIRGVNVGAEARGSDGVAILATEIPADSPPAADHFADRMIRQEVPEGAMMG
jgi:hypothetical protein